MSMLLFFPKPQNRVSRTSLRPTPRSSVFFGNHFLDLDVCCVSTPQSRMSETLARRKLPLHDLNLFQTHGRLRLWCTPIGINRLCGDCTVRYDFTVGLQDETFGAAQ
jgi:hypothetical protein